MLMTAKEIIFQVTNLQTNETHTFEKLSYAMSFQKLLDKKHIKNNLDFQKKEIKPTSQ
jgi:hypothetical protein